MLWSHYLNVTVTVIFSPRRHSRGRRTANGEQSDRVYKPNNINDSKTSAKINSQREVYSKTSLFAGPVIEVSGPIPKNTMLPTH